MSLPKPVKVPITPGAPKKSNRKRSSKTIQVPHRKRELFPEWGLPRPDFSNVSNQQVEYPVLNKVRKINKPPRRTRASKRLRF